MSDLITRWQTIANEVFGDHQQAALWLHEKNGALSGRAPFALLDTEEGGRLVEAVLGRIAHGIVE